MKKVTSKRWLPFTLLKQMLGIDLFIFVMLSLLLFNNNKTITNILKSGLKSRKKTVKL